MVQGRKFAAARRTRLCLSGALLAVIAAGCVAAPGPAPKADSTDSSAAKTAYRYTLDYVAHAPYRSGSDGDRAVGDWIAGELRAMGYAVSIESYPFQRYAINQAELRVGDFAPPVFPQYYSGATSAAGFDAPLVDIGSGSAAEAAAAKDAIALVQVPLLFNFFSPTLDSALRNAAAAGARALVVAFQGPANEIVVKNVDAGTGLCGLPVLLVGKQDGQRLSKLAGARAHFTLDAQLAAGEFRNVVARRGSGTDLLVVGTPVNGWFTAAGERGSGLGVMLELAREFSKKDLGDHSLVFLASGGHEVGYLGLPAFIDAHQNWLPHIGTYVHLGASIGVRQLVDSSDGGDAPVDLGSLSLLTFYVSENPLLQSLVAQSLRDGSRTLGSFTPPSMLNPGEQAAMYARHVPIAAASTSHYWFHTARDLPDLTGPVQLAPALAGYRDLISELLRRTTAQLRAQNRLADTLAKPAPAAVCAVPPR
ncbi:MAG: hypothetical protein JWQ90_3511 [Hydrocarboniphaga sp.]|uniref:M28 family peptidase n=1 Tax=Hydrocarboniphaga sp. TaxID=2033016 RepID=UPI00261AA623|nr:M28 family peptidase [Hydrocarboniphaga sp.]MDB5971061.1 hypothetical protein [Hydrocarboniphaga sp.]